MLIVASSGVAQAGDRDFKVALADFILETVSIGQICPTTRWSCDPRREAIAIFPAPQRDFAYFHHEISQKVDQLNRLEGSSYRLDFDGMKQLIYKTCRKKFVRTVDVFNPQTGQVGSKQIITYGETSEVSCLRKNIAQGLR